MIQLGGGTGQTRMLTRVSPKSLAVPAGAIAFWLPGSAANAVPLSPHPFGDNGNVSPAFLSQSSGSSPLVLGVLGAVSVATCLSVADSQQTRLEPVMRAANPTLDDDTYRPADMLYQKSIKRSSEVASRLLCGSPAERETGERSDTQQRDQTSPWGLTMSTCILHAEMVSRLTIAQGSHAIAPHLLEIFHPPRCGQA